MPEMLVSFTDKGDWFIFDAETGRTLNKGFRTRAQAENWVARKIREARACTS